MDKMKMTPSEYQERRRLELTRDDIISAIARCGRMQDDWNKSDLFASLGSALGFIDAKIARNESDAI